MILASFILDLGFSALGVGTAQHQPVFTQMFTPEEEGENAATHGGPHSRVCARLTLCSAPQTTPGKISGTGVCKVTFKHLPKPKRSHSQSFGTVGQLFKIPP